MNQPHRRVLSLYFPLGCFIPETGQTGGTPSILDGRTRGQNHLSHLESLDLLLDNFAQEEQKTKNLVIIWPVFIWRPDPGVKGERQP